MNVRILEVDEVEDITGGGCTIIVGMGRRAT